MRKQDMLYHQEYVWLINILDKEIIAAKEDLDASNGHPILQLRFDNLESLKVKLINQMNWRPKKRSKAGSDK